MSIDWPVGTIAEIDWRNDDCSHGGTCVAWKDVKGWSALDVSTGFLLPSDVTAVRPKRLVDADAELASDHPLATAGGRAFLAHLLALNPSVATLNAVVMILQEPAS